MHTTTMRLMSPPSQFSDHSQLTLPEMSPEPSPIVRSVFSVSKRRKSLTDLSQNTLSILLEEDYNEDEVDSKSEYIPSYYSVRHTEQPKTRSFLHATPSTFRSPGETSSNQSLTYSKSTNHSETLFSPITATTIDQLRHDALFTSPCSVSTIYMSPFSTMNDSCSKSPFSQLRVNISSDTTLKTTKSHLLSPLQEEDFGLPVHMLDYEFVRTCTCSTDLAFLIDYLKNKAPDEFPHLLKLANEKFQLIIAQEDRKDEAISSTSSREDQSPNSAQFVNSPDICVPTSIKLERIQRDPIRDDDDSYDCESKIQNDEQEEDDDDDKVTQIQAMQEQMDEIIFIHAEVQDSLAKAEKENEEMSQVIKSLEEKKIESDHIIEKLLLAKDNLEGELETLRQKTVESCSEARLIAAQLQSKEEEINKLKLQILQEQKGRKDIADNQALKFNEVLKNYASMEACTNALASALAESEMELAIVVEENKDLKDKLHNLEKSTEKKLLIMEDELKSSRKFIDSLYAEVTAKKEDLETLKKSYENQVSNLTSEINLLKTKSSENMKHPIHYSTPPQFSNLLSMYFKQDVSSPMTSTSISPLTNNEELKNGRCFIENLYTDLNSESEAFEVEKKILYKQQLQGLTSEIAALQTSQKILQTKQLQSSSTNSPSSTMKIEQTPSTATLVPSPTSTASPTDSVSKRGTRAEISAKLKKTRGIKKKPLQSRVNEGQVSSSNISSQSRLIL